MSSNNTKSETLSVLIEALSKDMRHAGAAAAELSFDNYKYMVHVTIQVSELDNN